MPAWKHHFLVSAGVFSFLAYRFDNRMVLSLGLASLAAWLGLSIAGFPSFQVGQLRPYALIYALLLVAIGWLTHAESFKRHFLDIYFNFAAHLPFIALVSGLWKGDLLSVYPLLLVFAVAAAVIYGRHSGRFIYLAYGIFYGYVGLSILVVDRIRSPGIFLGYFVVSATVVVFGLFRLARTFRRNP